LLTTVENKLLYSYASTTAALSDDGTLYRGRRRAASGMTLRRLHRRRAASS
jgi:hypothetical protein